MRWVLVLLSFALVSLWGVKVALSEQAGATDAPEPKKRAQRLIEGQEAPFTGTLVDTSQLARTAAKAERCDGRVDLARQEEKEDAAIDIDFQRALRANDREMNEKKIKLLERALPQWWEHPVIWVVFGMALTGAAIGTSVAIINATRPEVVVVNSTP